MADPVSTSLAPRLILGAASEAYEAAVDRARPSIEEDGFKSVEPQSAEMALVDPKDLDALASADCLKHLQIKNAALLKPLCF